MADSERSDRVWDVAPVEAALGAGEVHVWLARTDAAGLCSACCEYLLSEAERERAARFRFDKDRRLYTTAHAALRSILAGYLIRPPAQLEFESGERGKPRLAPPFAADRLEFNLSHSFEVALIAVARAKEIGVDVEHIRENFGFLEVAQRFFTAKEVIALRSLPEALQRRAFYQCWTSKEAFLKAKGVGLSGELDEVQILLDEQGIVRVKGTLSDWALHELDPCEGYAGAVVVQGGVGDLTCRRWPGPSPATMHLHS